MADINLDELLQALQQTTESMHRLNNETRESGVLSAARNQAQAQAAQEAQRRKALLKETSDNLTTFKNQLTGTLSSLASGNAGIGQLSGVVGTAISAVGQLAGGIIGLIPGLGAMGAAVSKLGEIAGKVAETAVQQLQVGFDAFRQAAKTGVVDSFTDLRDMSGKLNFRMEEMSGVLGSNSEKLAQLGGSALAGKNIFKDLASSSEGLQRKFMRLGTDAVELANIQITMANQFSRFGMSVNGIRGVQEDYLINLQALSQLTGKSKEELQKQDEARMRQAKLRGYMETIGPGRTLDLQMLLGFIQNVSPQMYEGYASTFANRGRTLDQPGKDLYLATGGKNIELFNQFRSGKSLDELIQYVVKDIAPYAYERMKPYTETLSPDHPLVKGFADVVDVKNLKPEKVQELLKSIKRSLEEGKTTEDKKIGDAAHDMRIASANFQQALLNVPTIVTMVGFAAKSMRQLSESVRDLVIKLGGNAPPPPGTPVITPESSMSFSDDASAIMQAAEQGQYEKAQKQAQAEKIKELTKNAELERPKNAERLEQMVAKIKDSFPGAKITSTVRDYGDNLNSKHPLGRAIDFVIPDYDMSKTDEYMAKLRGLGFTEVLDEYIYKSIDKTGDHLHAAFKDGGITRGPSLAGEAGPEAVVPLPDGRSIPVNFENSSELVTIWKRIESRLDALVSLTESSNYTQQKQLQYARS